MSSTRPYLMDLTTAPMPRASPAAVPAASPAVPSSIPPAAQAAINKAFFEMYAAGMIAAPMPAPAPAAVPMPAARPSPPARPFAPLFSVVAPIPLSAGGPIRRVVAGNDYTVKSIESTVLEVMSKFYVDYPMRREPGGEYIFNDNIREAVLASPLVQRLNIDYKPNSTEAQRKKKQWDAIRKCLANKEIYEHNTHISSGSGYRLKKSYYDSNKV